MKTIENLTGTLNPNGQFTESRGAVTSVHHQVAPGWFTNVALGPGGIVVRHGSEVVAITLEELLKLAAAHAPGLLPTAEQAEAATRARTRARDSRVQLAQPSR